MHTFSDLIEENEPMHPLWLGILILFSVMIIIGISCCIRRNFGSSICRLYNRLCCKNETNTDSKSNGYSPSTNTYNWAPTFIPSTSASPKIHQIIRTIQMSNFERQLTVPNTDCSEADNTENDSSSIVDNYDNQQVLSSPRSNDQPTKEINSHRNCEAARKFYASMRQTSQCQNSTSIESADYTPSFLSTNPIMKSTQVHKIKSFRTPRFFQSIRYQ